MEQTANPFSPGYKKPRGKYYYPPEYFAMRPRIMKKFDYQCFLCKKSGDEVHHIDYNKMNCVEENFVLLCKSCHLRTNANREYWKDYFIRVLKEE